MNETLRQLYQDTILEHQAHPRNHGPLTTATHGARVDNPLCGDRITLRLRLAGERVVEARFVGDGCALAIASASLLTTMVAGQRVDQARALEHELGKLLARSDADYAEADRARLGELVALEGTRRFPSRIRCATLAWEALLHALDGGEPPRD
jgi:nitrogen fixation NifU-like protein